MAEIHLQRKSLRVWPAVVAALALVALVWLVAAMWAVDEDERDQPDEAAQSLPAEPEIAPTSGMTPTRPGRLPPSSLSARQQRERPQGQPMTMRPRDCAA